MARDDTLLIPMETALLHRETVSEKAKQTAALSSFQIDTNHTQSIDIDIRKKRGEDDKTQRRPSLRDQCLRPT